MKKSFTKVLLLALAIVSMGVLGSCKDYEEDRYNDLKFQIADQDKSLRIVKDSLTSRIDSIVENVKSCDCDNETLKNNILAILRGEFTQGIDSLGGVDKHLIDSISGAYKHDLDSVSNALADSVLTINNRIATANLLINDLQYRQEQDSIRIDSLCNVTINLDNRITSVYNELKNDIREANRRSDAADAALNAKIDQTRSELLSLMNDLRNEVKANAEAIETLQQLLEKTQDYIVDHEIRISKIEKTLKEIEEDLYNKMITGVVLQGTKNPVFGSLNLPAGITSNVLVSYYGKAVNTVAQFVATSQAPGIYAKRSDELTAGDAAILNAFLDIQAGDVLLTDATDNAGKLYVTVNPNTVDFTGKSIQLVNSKDEECPITLSPLAVNEDELTLGYSRAGNGLYAAEAKVSKENIDAIKFNTEGWENEVKDAYNKAKDGKYAVAASELALSLYKHMNGMLPALAAKATWTDKNGDDHSVYSNYNVAATAVKPLSYTFAQDLNVKEIPGYKKAVNVVNKLVDNIVENIHKALEGLSKLNYVGYVTINHITAPTVDVIDVYVDLPYYGTTGVVYYADDMGLWLEDLNTGADVLVYAGNAIYNENGQAVIRLTKQEIDMNPQIAEIFDAINDALASTNDQLDDVVDEVNQVIAEINAISGKIDDSAADIRKQLIDMLESVNNKIVKLINGANKALMPVLVVNTDKGAKFGSRAQSAPTVASQNVTLIPTSYTAELLAPAYKKVVACTKAWKNGAEDTDARDAFNGQENINTVLNGGNVAKLPVTLEAGVKYEITYAAVDYTGTIAVRKSYIECK